MSKKFLRGLKTTINHVQWICIENFLIYQYLWINESIGHWRGNIRDIPPPYLLRNHLSSWGLMFVEYQHFVYCFLTLGHNFVGNWFVATWCKTIHICSIRLWWCKFVKKGNPWNPWTLNLFEHWWVHSTPIHVLL